MLPPRHRSAAYKAFWSYWPRRFLEGRGIVVLLLICAVIMILVSVLMPQTAQKTRAAAFDRIVTSPLADPEAAAPLRRAGIMVDEAD